MTYERDFNVIIRFPQEYTTSDGKTVDLLKESATKEHANLFVTGLIDIVYKTDEFLAIETAKVPTDERYLLIKGS